MKPYKVYFKNSHLGTDWRVIASFETYEEAKRFVDDQNYHIDSHYKIEKE